MKKISWYFCSFLFFASAPSHAGVGIPCLDDQGKVRNANASDVCKSSLLSCKSIKQALEKEVKNMVQWKIHGYYFMGDKGRDLDLLKSEPDKNNFVGNDLSLPICSVVGHKLTSEEVKEGSNGKAAGEFDYQLIGKKQYCGDLPEADNDEDDEYKTELKFDSKRTRWSSYILGAYPWILRRQTYDVLHSIPDDMNLEKVFTSAEVKKDIANLVETYINASKGLLQVSKTMCDQESLVEQCLKKPSPFKMGEPQIPICTLVSAQYSLTKIGVNGLLLAEVQKKSLEMHNKYFLNLLSFNDKNSKFQYLFETCSRDVIPSFSFNDSRIYSCFVSCLMDGKRWYTNASWDGNGKSWMNSPEGDLQDRKCSWPVRFNLETGEMVYGMKRYAPLTFPYLDFDTMLIGAITYAKEWPAKSKQDDNMEITRNVGFAGLVERTIRFDVCQQKKRNDKNSPCELVGIGSDKPQ